MLPRTQGTVSWSASISFPWSKASLISARGLSRSGVRGLCSSGCEVTCGAGAGSETEGDSLNTRKKNLIGVINFECDSELIDQKTVD